MAVVQAIADATGGRFYYPHDPNELPRIFIKEAKTLKRSMIQNKVFTPTVEFPSPVLKGIEALPELHGYVLTSPKPRASTILKGPEKEEVDPVLATWRFGLGTTAAWTSDLAPNWAVSWVEWEKYEAFVKQLAQEISRVERKSELHLNSFASGGNGMLLVEDFHPQESFLEIEARVTGPHQRTENITLKQIAPHRYQAQFPLWGKGRIRCWSSQPVRAGRNRR